MKLIVFTSLFIALAATLPIDFPIAFDVYMPFNAIADLCIATVRKDKGKHAEIFSNIDQDCVRSKLNLSENGDKIISMKSGMVAGFGAAILCLIDTNEEMANSELLQHINSMTTPNEINTIDKLNCIKLKLKELNPSDDLVQNFNLTAISYKPDEICDELTTEQHNKGIQIFDEGTKLFDTIIPKQCKKLDLKFIMEITYRLYIIKNENRGTEALNVEIRKILSKVRELIQDIFDCAMIEIKQSETSYSADI